jgi:hypothetical protein
MANSGINSPLQANDGRANCGVPDAQFAGGRGMKKQGSCSFLKKRTKKLLFPRLVRLARNQTDKSFLVLFFKKELLPCFRVFAW